MDIDSPKKSKSKFKKSDSSISDTQPEIKSIYLTRSQKRKQCRLRNIPSDTSLQSLLEKESEFMDSISICQRAITKNRKYKKKPRDKTSKSDKPMKKQDSDVDSKGNAPGLIDYSYDYGSTSDSDYVPTEHETEDTSDDSGSLCGTGS